MQANHSTMLRFILQVETIDMLLTKLLDDLKTNRDRTWLVFLVRAFEKNKDIKL